MNCSGGPVKLSGKATIYAVAQQCGVSTATVSRIMSDSSFGKKSTRERAFAAARDLGWVPNGAARSLASNRAGIIGVIFPDLGRSGATEDESPLYVDEMIRGAERAATLAGEAVLIAASRGASGRHLLRSIVGKVDGLVIVSGSLPEREISTISRTVPVIIVASLPGRRVLDRASVDNRSGAREITAHLVETHGYRELAFVGGPLRSPDSAERFAGFCEVLATAQIDPPEAPDGSGDFTEEGGAEAMRRLLLSGRKFRAVVFGNDEMAIGGLRTLRRARVRVPGDIAVTGFDDIASSRRVSPALTTVRQPMRELGERAVEMLLSRIENPAMARQVVTLPTAVVVRRSCGCRTNDLISQRGV